MFELRIARAAKLVASVAISVAAIHGAAQAAPITFSYEGAINFVSAELGGEFAIGQTVSGSFTYESTTPENGFGNSNFAVYDALSDFNFAVNSASNYAASSNSPAEIQVDNSGFDRFATVSRVSQGLAGTTPNVGSFELVFAGLRLADGSGAVFSDALILPTDLDLADFNSTFFSLTFVDPNGQKFFPFASAKLTSLEKVADDVPEPGSLALFVVLLGGFWFVTQRGKMVQA